MKRAFPVLSLLICTTILSAQYDPKENFYDAEFFFAQEDYQEALYAYNQVYKQGYQDNANINYRIGVCLLNIDGRKTEAIPYLEKATESVTDRYREGRFKEESAPQDVYLYLGNAYRINYELDKACEQYDTFLSYLDPDDQTTQAIYTRKQIDACERAKEAVADPVDYQAGILGQLNEPGVEIINPAVSGDLETFAFNGVHKFYDGVYVTRKKENKWMRPSNITPSIQSDGNQYVLSLSHDGNKILLAWRDQFESDIYMTEYANGRWNRSRPMERPVNSKYYESHACLTPDGNTIYFTSNRKESIGGMDLFRATRTPDGEWGELELLGEHINTPLNEETPYVSPDGKRLYFSSQGHETLGGFDVFYAEIAGDGSLGDPVNLDYPLNTTDDDLTFVPNAVDFPGYLTLYSKGEKEQLELFRFEFIPESAQPVAVAFLEEPEEEEMVEEVAEEVSEAVEETVEEVAEETTEEIAEEAVEEVVEETTEAEADKPVKKYIIKPVFFGFDSYALSATAESKLDDLLTVLKRFPSLHIQVNGHTDAVGDEQYNRNLSLNRAHAVAKYLMKNGIDEERIRISAIGEKDHVAINRTADGRDAPKGRELNRRVEFRIVTDVSEQVEIATVEVPEYLKIK